MPWSQRYYQNRQDILAATGMKESIIVKMWYVRAYLASGKLYEDQSITRGYRRSGKERRLLEPPPPPSLLLGYREMSMPTLIKNSPSQ